MDELLIEKLNQLFADNKGSCPIQFTVFDTIEGLEINLPSRSVRVKPSNELFKDLAKLDIDYKLNQVKRNIQFDYLNSKKQSKYYFSL